MRSGVAQVSIGLPFTDQTEHEFRLSVQSVFAQDFQDWTLILYGDAPNSALLTLAREIKDPRVEVRFSPSQKGLAATLNQITRHARTPYLARMDADDVMHPGRITAQFTAATANPRVDLIGARAYVIDQTDTVRGLLREPAGVPESPRGYLRSHAFTHPTVFGKTEWFARFPYDESFQRCQDKALWMYSNQHSIFAKLDQPLLFYRVSEPLSASAQRRSSKWDRFAVRKHGPAIAPAVSVAGYLLRSHVKQRVFATASRVRPDLLYSRKYVPAPNPTDAELALARVRTQNVPGWT